MPVIDILGREAFNASFVHELEEVNSYLSKILKALDDTGIQVKNTVGVRLRTEDNLTYVPATILGLQVLGAPGFSVNVANTPLPVSIAGEVNHVFVDNLVDVNVTNSSLAITASTPLAVNVANTPSIYGSITPIAVTGNVAVTGSVSVANTPLPVNVANTPNVNALILNEPVINARMRMYDITSGFWLPALGLQPNKASYAIGSTQVPFETLGGVVPLSLNAGIDLSEAGAPVCLIDTTVKNGTGTGGGNLARGAVDIVTGLDDDVFI